MRILLTRPQHALLSYRFPDIGLGYLATGLRKAGRTVFRASTTLR